MPAAVNIFWFRRDLRLHDNAGLYHALHAGLPVVPIFIFDRHILDELEDCTDRRVEFIHQALENMQAHLLKIGATLDVRYGFPEEIFVKLQQDYIIRNVYANHDYDPYAILRDKVIAEMLKASGITFNSFKDQVIFEKNEILKGDGKPYSIFTPYSRKWKAAISEHNIQVFDSRDSETHFLKQKSKTIPSLESLGFKHTDTEFPGNTIDKTVLFSYHLKRDFPALSGTTRLSVHLRFGTISIRELVTKAVVENEKFLNELIWRDFYQMILCQFPQVITQSFKSEYDKIDWRNNEKEFEAWCNGNTGYPIVDAGMRELNETGFMHNRVRMIVASFLVKHLLIDWRWGEAYFAKKLLDYDLASNNGSWQWAAGSGCDAAPYFRIFNPYRQTEKFDPDLKYIRQWVTDLDDLTYPAPIVEHEFARERCLRAYKAALNKS